MTITLCDKDCISILFPSHMQSKPEKAVEYDRAEYQIRRDVWQHKFLVGLSETSYICASCPSHTSIVTWTI